MFRKILTFIHEHRIYKWEVEGILYVCVSVGSYWLLEKVATRRILIVIADEKINREPRLSDLIILFHAVIFSSTHGDY